MERDRFVAGRSLLCVCALLFAGISVVSLPGLSGADIYRYVDGDGTVHYTNTPTTPEFEIYMREPIFKRRSERRAQPGEFDEYIQEAAKLHEVPVSLVEAVIRVESDYDPDAVSQAGACGLMQIMPDTADELGLTDAFDPRENILAGVRYLKSLLDQFGGDVALALAAYNAGPDRVELRGEVPPIRETRDYVRRVLQYYRGGQL